MQPHIGFRSALCSGLLAALLMAGMAVRAEDAGTKRPWWPSEWGADDQAGALNRLTPAKVLEAAALITQGKVYDLGRVFEDSMPLFSLTPHHRKFTLVIPGGPTYGPMGENRLVWNEDFISGHLTQDGTQFDSFAHMATVLGDKADTRNIRYYNGFRHADIADAHGFKKLGTEHVRPIFTRGVLIDIAGLKGRMLKGGEEITIADLKAALARQGLAEADIHTGDALLYNTGWGGLWKVDNNRFNSSVPGLSPAAGDWVVARKVVLVGTDNWAVEAIPNPDARLFAPNHQKFLVENGIHIIENMDFSTLIADKVWVFAFVYGALPLKGATGAPARPFAVR